MGEVARVSQVVDWMVDTLGSGLSSVPTGDHEAPREGGWSEGDPNTGVFTPYYVVRFMGSRAVESMLYAGCRDWILTMRVSAYGVSRGQATDLLNDAGDLLVSNVSVDYQVSPGYKFARVLPMSLTGVAHDKTVNPHVWSCHMSVECDLRWTR